MARGLSIRPYAPGDEASIVDAWNQIFPAQDDIPERDVAYWNWEFRDNPLRATESIVAVDGDRVVGQYACVPLHAVDEGNAVTVGLVVDAFVLPGYRRAGGGPGLVIELARRLHATYCGPRATARTRGHTLTYGYPFPIWRIAQRYLDSEMVGDMDILFREIAASGFVPCRPGEGVGVRIVDSADVGDAAWKLVAPEVRFGLVRDSAWLDWRYVRHPRGGYRIHAAFDESSGAVRGVAVYKRGRYVHDDCGIVCDWIVPADDEPATDALLHALEQTALSDGAGVLLGVLPQNHPAFLWWQRKGFLVGPPSHFLVMNTFGPHVRYLRERWFYTLGDSDLV